MDLRAEKLNVISQLLRVEDELLLQAIKNMLEVGLRKQTPEGHDGKIDFWDEFTEEQKEAIEKSIRQLDEGQGIPHEEVMATLKKKYRS